MNIKFAKPFFSNLEHQAVKRVLSQDILVHGNEVKNFEKVFTSFTKSKHSLATSSCTTALLMAYKYFNISRNDEVIVPAQTHVATIQPIEYFGAKPIFVDSNSENGNIDVNLIEKKITKKTKGISIVHFLGYPANLGKIKKICKKYNLFLIEDCALAVGSKYKGKHVGTFGDFGCFSFYPVKHITTTEGGMITLQSKEKKDYISSMRALGVNRDFQNRKIPGQYDVKSVGLNFRLNEISSCLGIVQMSKINKILKIREANFNYLYNKLKKISEISLFNYYNKDYTNSFYCLSIILPKDTSRLKLISYLNAKNIQTSIYYPSIIPNFTYYKKKYNLELSSFYNSHKISTRSIALPVGPHLNIKNMHSIYKTIKEYFN